MQTQTESYQRISMKNKQYWLSMQSDELSVWRHNAGVVQWSKSHRT